MNIEIKNYTDKILILFLLISTGAVLPRDTLKNTGHKLYLNFSVLESSTEAGRYAAGNDKEQGFVNYNYGDLPHALPQYNRMITLRAAFRLAPGLKGENPLAVLCPSLEYPANIYLNGSLIAKRGDYTEGYTSRLHKARTILLPPGLLKYAPDVNQIALELYPKYGENYRPFSKVYVSGYHTASTDEFWRNLLGPGFSFAIMVFSIIIFLYFFALFMLRKEYDKLYYLYFGLLNLALCFSQANNAFSFDYQNVMLMEKISKAAYNFATLFTVLFILEITGLFKHKRRIQTAALIIFAAGVVIVLLSPNYSTLLRYYFLHVLIFHIPVYVFAVVCCWLFFIKKKSRTSLAFFIFYLTELFLIANDLYFMLVLHEKPYVLLIPFGMFLINIVLFFMLAWEQTVVYRQSVERGRKLSELSENLELLVQERTNKLNETVKELNLEIEQRKIFQEELKEANNTKDKLFSIMSHDLKNVFNSVIGVSELIIKDAEDGLTTDISTDVALIRDSSRRAYLFLENLLEWSASQSGMLSPAPEKFSVKLLAEDVVNLFKIQAGLKEINIENEIPEELYAFADKRMLQTVLRNLISNAIKFSYTGGKILLKAEAGLSAVKISVSDNGIGFEPASENPADVKARQNSAIRNSGKGSGIGLLLVKEMLKAQNSSLSIQSRPGCGSTFSFAVAITE
ncbi:MAG TPA: ATP-binding protein [Ignavibacteriales bacterium]|nr:ATP-binding protein [Ignavibacteriales bacterium]